jgi:hypothetical protein
VNLPAFTAQQTLRVKSTIIEYTVMASSSGATQGVTAMVALDCLESCVGSDTALHCSSQCGSDVNCWRQCAGAAGGQCVSRCL